MLDPEQSRTADDEINWIDEWTKTNMLPTALELTLWMEPAEEDGEPIESRRIVEIPMGVLSQNPNLGSSSNEESRRGTSTSVGGRSSRRGNRVQIETNRGGNSGGRPSARPQGGPTGGMTSPTPGGMPPPMPR